MSFARALTLPMAALSLGAAAIHFAVLEEHLAEFWLFGFLFLCLGWFQALWPVAYLIRPSTLIAWAGAAVNAGAVIVWWWSRTFGLPIGPEPVTVEPVGPLDITATAYEVVIVGMIVLLWSRWTRDSTQYTTLRGAPAWLGSILWSAVVLVIASAALLAPVTPHASH